MQWAHLKNMDGFNMNGNKLFTHEVKGELPETQNNMSGMSFQWKLDDYPANVDSHRVQSLKSS